MVLKRVGLCAILAGILFAMFRHHLISAGTAAEDTPAAEASAPAPAPGIPELSAVVQPLPAAQINREPVVLESPSGERVDSSASPLVAGTKIRRRGPLPACPADRPLDLSSCHLDQSAGLRCAYGEQVAQVICDCLPATESTESTWRCKSAPVAPELTEPCPTDQPSAASSCAAPGQVCVYGAGSDPTACRCLLTGSARWECIPYVQWRGPK
jgi:hypothetical protein